MILLFSYAWLVEEHLQFPGSGMDEVELVTRNQVFIVLAHRSYIEIRIYY